jgi:hypothetical protein
MLLLILILQITAAFICLVSPFDAASEDCLLSLGQFNNIIGKLPNRWHELTKVKNALKILTKLTMSRLNAWKAEKPAAAIAAAAALQDQSMASTSSLEGVSPATPFNALDFGLDGYTMFGNSSINAPAADQPMSDIVAWWSDIFSIPLDTSDINLDTETN